jgi:hypothetical protein
MLQLLYLLLSFLRIAKKLSINKGICRLAVKGPSLYPRSEKLELTKPLEVLYWSLTKVCQALKLNMLALEIPTNLSLLDPSFRKISLSQTLHFRDFIYSRQAQELWRSSLSSKIYPKRRTNHADRCRSKKLPLLKPNLATPNPCVLCGLQKFMCSRTIIPRKIGTNLLARCNAR